MKRHHGLLIYLCVTYVEKKKENDKFFIKDYKFLVEINAILLRK